MTVDIKASTRQKAFLKATAFEVLYGGAAGGGKSFGQIIDAFLFAMRYQGSKQLILRRTFPELDKSLIRTALGLYPREIYKYNSSAHTMTFKGGSIIDFGYCDNANDVYKYQSAEYDVIRFDELTHFTEDMYVYLISRVRGTNGFPKQVKSSTNPGGVGHTWVKERFIDIGPPDTVYTTEEGNTRIFLPAKVQDNPALMANDPDYVKRLENLSEKDKKALLYGDWDIFDGQYFTEWKREKHVMSPFPIPAHWRRYFAMDYGLDMLAGYWIAVDDAENAYVYREVYKSGLIISEAAREIAANDDDTYAYFAPPDLWNRRQDTGKSAAQIFSECGIPVQKAENDRKNGWLALREWLAPRTNEFGEKTPRLRIFNTCVNLIRTLPALCVDKSDPNDVAREPHELTHAPDAIRYFVAGRPRAVRAANTVYDREIEEFLSYGV